jgi:UDP-N-acetylmuramoyl-L-alanyl-D-glutamate--2,6-diaminopimelate ligase
MRTENNLLQKLINFYHLLQALLFNLLYLFPARRLKIIGVTGTDGKTTTTSLIYHILKKNAYKVAYISTINARMGDLEIDTGLHVTTPDPWMLPKYLKMIADHGSEYLVLESTSSGLQQNRLWGIRFIASTITNIKSDHLDYHETWENYAKAKFRIVKQTDKAGRLVLNGDDTKAYTWIEEQLTKMKSKPEIITYHKDSVANLSYTPDGFSFNFQKVKFELPLLGDYNVENALAAINVTSKFVKFKNIAKAVKSFPTPKGRMEVIQKHPFTVIIDFAHTPHALENALRSVNLIRSKRTRLIAVYGCAAKRDKARRLMGKVSAQLADVTILTAEDARNEKLADINSEIFGYAKEAGGTLLARIINHIEYKELGVPALEQQIEAALKAKQKPFIAFDEDAVASREDAIDLAIKIAQPGDVVFTTGKAHEQSLAFGTTEFPWSEHDVVAKSLGQSR